MKVLIIHNRYQHKGGEDSVVATELAQLREAGHEVALHEADNASIDRLGARIRTTLAVQNNPVDAGIAVTAAREFAAEVVHVHNFFPLLSPRLHRRLHEAGFPVVQTLHNYRLLCANGMFLREDRVCEDCVTGSRINALRYRCYRGSLIGSAAVLAMQQASVRSSAWHAAVNRIIALTQFQREKMIAGGLPADRVVVKGNSVADPGAVDPAAPRHGALFVGRLVPGKGLDVLLDAWAGIEDVGLTIAGDGPELERLKARAPQGVTFLGRIGPDEVVARMGDAAFLLLPSTWYEGFPMTLVEAFSCGLPVLASRLGGIPEIVREGETGFLCTPGDASSLSEAVGRMASMSSTEYAAMSAAARARYLNCYSPQANVDGLLAIYRDAIAVG